MADAIKLNVWDGVKWTPVAGNEGPQGPAGADGESVNVFVQTVEPTPARPGDHWINTGATRSMPTPVTSTEYANLDQVGNYPTLDDLKAYNTLDDLKGN